MSRALDIFTSQMKGFITEIDMKETLFLKKITS